MAARQESEAKDAQRDISMQGLERGHGSVVERVAESRAGSRAAVVAFVFSRQKRDEKHPVFFGVNMIKKLPTPRLDGLCDDTSGRLFVIKIVCSRRYPPSPRWPAPPSPAPLCPASRSD